jgi:CHAT domain-containing protein
LLEYAFGEKHLFIHVIRHDTLVWQAVPIDSAFYRTIRDYLKAIEDGYKGGFVKHSTKLYQLLIKPIATHLKGVKHLLIIPDDVLHTIPFEALLTRSPKSENINFTSLPYLLRDFTIQYYPSATMAFEERNITKIQPTKDFLGFAPVFDKHNDNTTILEINRAIGEKRQFNHLPYSESEIKQISAFFEASGKTGKVFLHQAATEDNLKQAMADYRFVHIASHSKADSEHLNLSYIACSQPDSTAFAQSYEADKPTVADGILYAGEVYNLRFNPDLLVLSSCETGMGKLAQGEGVLSLLRGFIYAGARNIIYSLWALEDENTARLMISFYKNLLKNKQSYPEALRQAKLSFLKKSDYAAPKWWSGMVLMGN